LFSDEVFVEVFGQKTLHHEVFGQQSLYHEVIVVNTTLHFIIKNKQHNATHLAPELDRFVSCVDRLRVFF